MKKIGYFIISILLCTTFLSKQPVFSITSDSIAKKIEIAIRSGSSKNLSSYFHKSIRLKVVGNSNIYSKKQAEMIISTFFHENSPGSYKITSQKENGKAQSIIGIFKSEKRNYRFYYRLSEYNNRLQICYLEIEAI